MGRFGGAAIGCLPEIDFEGSLPQRAEEARRLERKKGFLEFAKWPQQPGQSENGKERRVGGGFPF